MTTKLTEATMMIKTIQTILLLGLSIIAFAKPNTDSLLVALDHATNDSQRFDIYLGLAETQEKSSLSEAINWLNRAEIIANKENNISQKKQIIRTKGFLYQQYEQTDSSIVYFRKYLSPRYPKTGIDSAQIYNKFGVYYLSLENPDSALFYLNLGAKIHQHINDTIGLINMLNNMGSAFINKGDLIQAKNYFEQAYFIGLKLEDYKNFAVLQSNYLGIQYMLGKDPDELLKLIQKTFKHLSLNNNIDLQANVYVNMGTVFLDQYQDLEKAEELYTKALKIYASSDYKTDPTIYHGLGNVYKEKKQYPRAIQFYHQSLALGGELFTSNLTYIKLAEIHTNIGNSDSTAYYYLEVIKWQKENQIKHSEEQRLKAIKFLEVVKKESQITALENQHKIDVLKENRSRILLGSTLFIFLFALTIFILLLNRKKREAALQNAALQLKNKDLVNLSLHINEKNQILKAFEEKIEADKNKTTTDQTLYTEVQNTLKKSLKLDEDWQQFEIYLNDLHAGFYANLKAKHPNLTKTELRVCSLSKLRYSLKESAQTLSISSDSVKSARYRVKKKMELTAEQDLADYLNNL